MINIKRDSPSYRVCKFDNLEVESFIFYSKGKILYKCNSGFLVDENTNQDITQITINEPKRAIKENLNKTNNFFIRGRRDYKFDKGYIFYINCDLENINITETDFKEKFKDGFESTQYKYKIIKTKIPFLIYKSYLDKNNDLKHKEVETKQIRVFNQMRIKPFKRGIERDKILKHLEKHKIKISKYELENFLKVLKIEIKRGV